MMWWSCGTRLYNNEAYRTLGWKEMLIYFKDMDKYFEHQFRKYKSDDNAIKNLTKCKLVTLAVVLRANGLLEGGTKGFVRQRLR